MYRLLIVDDEEIIRRGIKKFVDFELLGIGEVFEAKNGQEALELVKSQSIDLVLADINMPKLNGLEFAIQAKEFNSNICIAMITGYDYLDYAINAIKAGVDDYVLKPVSRVDIQKILKELINKRIEREKLTNIREIVENGMEQREEGPEQKTLLSRIIETNLSNSDFSLQQMAEETNFNVSYLSQLFKKNFGINFREYLLLRRMEKCKILILTTNMKNYEIAQAVGIDDPNYLSTCFKRTYNLSLSEYRARLVK